MAGSEAPHQPPPTDMAGLPHPAVEHRAPHARDDPEAPHPVVNLAGIRTAGRARGRPLLQSHAAVAARHQVDGGPTISGVRLQLRDNRLGAPLMDVQLYDEAGEWHVGTGLAGGATLRAYGALPGEVRGVRVQAMDRRGPGDPCAKITGLKFLLADGKLIPDSCALIPMEGACEADALPASWTQVWWLPADARFAGLLLHTGWPQEPTSDDTRSAWLQGPPALIDLQVLHTSWLTCNPNANTDTDLNWAASDAVTAMGPQGLLLRSQTTGGRRYGLVDVGVGQAGEAACVAIGNQDFTEEGYIPTNGRIITGIRAIEIDHQGITDLAFRFEDGSCSQWIFNTAGPPADAKIWSHDVPEGHWAVGLRVRAQHHFGIVDVCLRTNEPMARIGVTMSDDLPCPAAEPTWEWVRGPLSR